MVFRDAVFVARATRCLMGVRGFRRHSLGTAVHAAAIAARLGLPVRDVATAFFGGLFHDVGKAGMPFLLKGALSEAERARMEAHPHAGGAVLRALGRTPFARRVAEIAEQHHPYGPGGEKPVFLAQVVQAADTIQAMREYRPYQLPFPREEIALVLERNRHLTPRVRHAAVLHARRDALLDLTGYRLPALRPERA